MQVKCPKCGKMTEYNTENLYRPFCTKLCKESDLFDWLIDIDEEALEILDDIPEIAPEIAALGENILNTKKWH